MGFLRNLFGGKKSEEYVDTRGVYFYVRCNNCGCVVRLRADKHYDLETTGSEFTWHKTIVDNKCFRPIPAVVTLNSSYDVKNADIQGGEFVTEADYEQWQQEAAVQRELARRQAENAASAADSQAQSDTDPL